MSGSFPRRRGVALACALLGAIVWAIPAGAHVLSVSQGRLQVDGSAVRYELRMPLVEVPERSDREALLLGALEVLHDGQAGTRRAEDCRTETGQGPDVFVCEAVFEFPQMPSVVDVRCDLPSVTVPHHIHILRSSEGKFGRQTVFDITSKEAEIRFTPPTFTEVFATEVGAGARKALLSPELLLILVAVALASRGRKELRGCIAAFLTMQGMVAVLVSVPQWTLPARFVEAAAALTVAYLASEILFLPETANRSWVCGAMGCFHGLFLGGFLVSAQMNAPYVLTGAFGVEGIVACSLGALRLRLVTAGGERLVAILLLVGGLGWFGLRLIR